MFNSKNIFLYDPELQYSVQIGNLNQTDEHKHYSMHLMCPLEGALGIMVDGKKMMVQNFLVIASNVVHQYMGQDDNPIMVISLGPISNFGVYLEHILQGHNSAELDMTWISEIRRLGLELYDGTIDKAGFIDSFKVLADKHIADPFSLDPTRYDARIVQAIRFIIQNSHRVIPAEELAERTNLSVDRLLHLIKNETGITYRRMQIWIKLAESFKHFADVSSLTELAHQSGFSDSAHYSRLFKETFGLSPSSLLKS